MAKYNIISLNYIASGEKRCYVNIDTVLDYQLSSYVYVLDTEAHISGNIRTEQGDYNVVDTQYFQYEDGNHEDEAIAQEKSEEDLLIPEKITKVNETNPENGRLILLKREDNGTQYLEDLREFNRKRFEYNRTFVIPSLNDSERNDSAVNFLDYGKNQEINPMYEIKDVCIKSSLQKITSNPNLPLTDTDIDIYAPSMSENPIQFCQTVNDAAMLDTFNDRGLYYIRVNKDNTGDGTYTTELKSKTVENIVYTPYEKLSIEYTIDEYDEYGNKIGEHIEISVANSYEQYLSVYGNDVAENIFDDYYSMKGLNYNYIYLLDQSNNTNDFKGGNVAATQISLGKNAYNSTYSQDIDLSNNIYNCREYCGIGFSNNTIYLKYIDGINYKCSNMELNDHNKYDCMMNKVNNNSYGYQKIEFLSPIKTAQKARHKSNMFSVNIQDSNIEELVYEEDDNYDKLKQIQDNIKKDITNAIRTIVDYTCPLNTQLFNVYFQD